MAERIIWTRERLLEASGIKAVEWPEGWYLHAEPEPHVSPKPPVMKRRRKRK